MKYNLSLLPAWAMLMICCIPATRAGDWSTAPEHWGLGFINYDPAAVVAWAPGYGICFPQGAGLPAYETASRERLTAMLFIEAPVDQAESPRLRYFPTKGASAYLLEGEFPTDKRRISYENEFLLYTEIQNGFVKILPTSLNGGVWIAIKDLRAFGFQAESWQQYLHRTYASLNLLPPDRFAMNLREKPGIEAQKLVSLKGDAFIITLTGTFEGLWAEVNVTEYTEHPCLEGRLTGRKWTGWLKLLDNQGFPNIWYHPSGC